MKISVAMAAYNGEKYIEEQINSILPQLSSGDEIIVSLDNSKDKTLSLLEKMQRDDDRIRIIKGTNTGVIANFENAIKNTSGEIIFLCDQDDVWKKNKVKTVVKAFSKDVYLVLHDAYIVDENLRVIEDSFFKMRGTNDNFLKNIVKNSFIGCCMAFRREVMDYALPFPKNLPMHDQWLGLIALKKYKVKLVHEKLLYYRRHGENVSEIKHSTPPQMLKWRVALIYNLLKNYNTKNSRRNDRK